MKVTQTAMMALAASGILMAATPAAAECANDAVKVKLPAGRLDTRLQDISHKTGCPLNVDPAIVGNKRAPVLRGTYTPAQMLNLSLMRSGLVSTWEDGQWVIKPHKSLP